MNKQSALDTILTHAANQSNDYRRGFEEGKAAALREITPNLTKVAEAAVAGILQEQEAQEAFRGQVAVHAAAREIARQKVSMAHGFCWDCKTSAPDPHSPYRRCSSCDSK